MTKDSNRFKFFIPGVEFEKAQDEKGVDVMKVRGIASTQLKDTDDEFLDPSGYDLSYFKNYGFFNWNHQAKDNPSALIGEPTDARITPQNEFYIEGFLWKDSKKAQETYDLINTLKSSGSTRKLGWSIEGKVLERDKINPKKVKRALITNVAITPTPKNMGTWLDVMKGELSNVDYEYDIEGQESVNTNQSNGGNTNIIDIIKPNGDRIVVDKDFNIKVLAKALAATTGTGVALKKEDVEGAIKYPNQIVKSLIIINEGHAQGLISEEDFGKIKNFIKLKFIKQN